MPLAGKPMLTFCARHVVVVKAASNAAIVNFMVVAIRESLELVGSLYINGLDSTLLDLKDSMIVTCDTYACFESGFSGSTLKVSPAPSTVRSLHRSSLVAIRSHREFSL